MCVQITVKNANFTHNQALWGGAVASFSSGNSASSSSSALESGSFLSSASDYDPYDLTPSLTTAGDGTTVTSAAGAVAPAVAGAGAGSGDGDTDADGDGDDGDADSGSSSPVKYLDCLFANNRASEDGGAICEL